MSLFCPAEPRYWSPRLMLNQQQHKLVSLMLSLSCLALFPGLFWLYGSMQKANLEIFHKAQQTGTAGMWRQHLLAGLLTQVGLSHELEGGSSYGTRTTLFRFSSQIWSRIINKPTASLKWQRTCRLIVMPPCIWSKMLKRWKAYASLCMFCSARELRFATKLQLRCAQAACVRPEARQQGLKAALDQDGDYCAPSALLARGLHREQALALVRSGLLPLLFRIQSSSSSSYDSHGSPWLVLALIGSNPSVFTTSTLLSPRLAAFLLKSWFCNLFTCGIHTEFDADKPALSSLFSGPAQSTTKYRQHIFSEEMVSLKKKKKSPHVHTLSAESESSSQV